MPFPTFDEWMSENGDDVERRWQFIHDEYGDAAPLLSACKRQLYDEAKEESERAARW